MTRRQVSDLFEVDDSTIDRYLAANEAELRHNGYVLMRGKSLKNIKLQFGSLINAGSKTTQLGLFTLRAVLNLAMLLIESERARDLRARMLDIVLDTIAERSGGAPNTSTSVTKIIFRRLSKKANTGRNSRTP